MTRNDFFFVCFVFIFSIGNCYSQTRYKYQYKFSLSTKIRVVEKDSTYTKQGLPDIYIIHSKQKMQQTNIDKIKNCVDKNREKPNNCGSKGLFYITLEI